MSDTATSTVTSADKLCTECGVALSSPNERRYARCKDCRTGGKGSEEEGGEVLENVRPLSISLDAAKPPPAPPTKHYWCGVTEDCPSHAVTIAGVSFPRWNGRVVERAPGRFEYVDRVLEGQVSALTERTVQLVLERVRYRVVRNRKIISALPLVRTRPPDHQHKEPWQEVIREFVPRDGDVPLAQFVYMIEVRGPNDRPMQNPPTLIPRGA